MSSDGVWPPQRSVPTQPPGRGSGRYEGSLDDVKALVFDVFGTLTDWRSSVIAALEDVGRRHGVERDWFEIADAWRAHYQPSLEPIRSGRRPFVPLDVLHRESLVAVLGHYGIVGLHDRELDALNHVWHRLGGWPDVQMGFRRLAPRFELASLSNANVAMAADLARSIGIRWDRILGAETARTYKPKPAVYLTAASALGLHPDEIMMVAAHNHDLEAASRLGFRTAMVLRPTEHGPAQSTDVTPSGNWDVVCNNLIELAEVLNASGGGSVATPKPLRTTRVRARADLTRARALTLAAVIATASALSFNSGYRLAEDQPSAFDERPTLGHERAPVQP